jgi:nucleotide-binding universal stress UspA family protein
MSMPWANTHQTVYAPSIGAERRNAMTNERDGGHGLVVVGVDTSEGARAALRLAIEEARLRQAKLRVIHAWQFDSYLGLSGFQGFLPAGVDLSELRRAAESVLDAVLDEIAPDPDGVVVERRVVEGAPAAVLVDESRNADLLIVGSRGLGGFAGLLLGSVSQQCAHHASCPVVIVHESTEGSD